MIFRNASLASLFMGGKFRISTPVMIGGLKDLRIPHSQFYTSRVGPGFERGRTMSTERREHQRFKLKVPVEIYPEDHETPFRGATTDLSLGGCYFESIFPFPVGTRLELKLQVDDTLLILATVVTCDSQFGNGIRFDKILPEDLEQLEAFLNSVAESATTANK